MFQTTLWGTLAYADSGIGYDAYLNAEVVPQSMRQNLSTQCGKCGVVPNSTNTHGVTLPKTLPNLLVKAIAINVTTPFLIDDGLPNNQAT
ncbi:hypothetical protein CONCODRAFT_12447 [Conidiobolus coronatus NRRL 28638]|uniref:Uncharacterized protein n=1 Tax=Conidiobolus coronatus (strain ATCC 28846 / CBS 209.66 / NRRL 28638) TaxID=796925 RepID=A0A137NSU9_CONC2|nr:hypothetical protein CONCODRAFT_12447 [Conidiobolus coronatus NRRL 28638]|eukprot:KXN65857.1 hypothetical protein CONCODRAFT_12447 [Conidiobolus coronatus NRRL 28638]